ncbi:MAG TPA: MarC family protein [Candidatus Binataceae bacterium]|nr:MarC family protein [Candidatus Binataceae bacterium]
MHEWSEYAQIAIALFVIADPIGTIPFFLSLTSDLTEEEKKHTAKITSLTVAIVLVLSVFAGEPLLRLFGIRIASFRVGGGILLLLMAIGMLYARPGRARAAELAAREPGFATVPLGVPLVAGPGAISTVVIYADQAKTWLDTLFLVAVALFVAASVWIALRQADPLSRLLGRTGINVVTRLLGLLLAAVAVQFIAGGLSQLLPGLAGHS